MSRVPKVHHFEDSSALGEMGVKVIESYLDSRDVAYVNVEGDKAYQRKDIDLVLRGRTGSVFPFKTIEVKTDSRVNNFFLETFSNLEEEAPGWVFKTEADVIFYVIPLLKCAYVLPVPELRLVCSDSYWLKYQRLVYNRDKWRKDISSRMDSRYYRKTVGLAIPYSELLAELKDRGAQVWKIKDLPLSDDQLALVSEGSGRQDYLGKATEIDESEVWSVPELQLYVRKV